MKNDDEVLFGHNDVDSGDVQYNPALSKIAAQDVHGVVAGNEKRLAMLQLLRSYQENGVTVCEMKKILAALKYDHNSVFSAHEIDVLALEMGLGQIERIHLPVASYVHSSRLDKARHAISYIGACRWRMAPISTGRGVPSDDVVDHEIRAFLGKRLGSKKGKNYVNGDMMYDVDSKSQYYVDSSGKKILIRTSQTKRPQLPVRSQESLRGRGVIASTI